MGKASWRDSDPSDPMYSEGPQSYSPHWGRKFLKPKTPLPPSTAGQQTPQRVGNQSRLPKIQVRL
jgi:hypothetical protein